MQEEKIDLKRLWNPPDCFYTEGEVAGARELVKQALKLFKKGKYFRLVDDYSFRFILPEDIRAWVELVENLEKYVKERRQQLRTQLQRKQEVLKGDAQALREALKKLQKRKGELDRETILELLRHAPNWETARTLVDAVRFLIKEGVLDTVEGCDVSFAIAQQYLLSWSAKEVLNLRELLRKLDEFEEKEEILRRKVKLLLLAMENGDREGAEFIMEDLLQLHASELQRIKKYEHPAGFFRVEAGSLAYYWRALRRIADFWKHVEEKVKFTIAEPLVRWGIVAARKKIGDWRARQMLRNSDFLRHLIETVQDHPHLLEHLASARFIKRLANIYPLWEVALLLGEKPGLSPSPKSWEEELRRFIRSKIEAELQGVKIGDEESLLDTAVALAYVKRAREELRMDLRNFLFLPSREWIRMKFPEDLANRLEKALRIRTSESIEDRDLLRAWVKKIAETWNLERQNYRRQEKIGKIGTALQMLQDSIEKEDRSGILRALQILRSLIPKQFETRYLLDHPPIKLSGEKITLEVAANPVTSLAAMNQIDSCMRPGGGYWQGALALTFGPALVLVARKNKQIIGRQVLVLYRNPETGEYVFVPNNPYGNAGWETFKPLIKELERKTGIRVHEGVSPPPGFVPVSSRFPIKKFYKDGVGKELFPE